MIDHLMTTIVKISVHITLVFALIRERVRIIASYRRPLQRVFLIYNMGWNMCVASATEKHLGISV